MRFLAAGLVVVAAGAGGCGGSGTAVQRTTTAAVTPPVRDGLRIGVVGPLTVRVAGALAERGSLDQVGGDPLVLVSAETTDAAAVAAAADRYPSTHFALVGGSTKGFHRPNLAGLVIRDDQAARLTGVVAALAVADQSVSAARVAWVGPEERALASEFAAGVHTLSPQTTVLREWASSAGATCKEAAIAATGRGATVLAAHGGVCARAVARGAHERNLVALAVDDFEVPDIVAAQAAHDAVAGVYHGDEDIVFGEHSGAIGIRRLDSRISPEAAAQARALVQQLVSGRRPAR
jgi:basic membrane lipoprotein Med (substrate-binding protein (PBP1-ABC) superfamily)